MATRARVWCRLVEQDSFFANGFVTLMAEITSYLLVGALQREIGLLLMVEKGRPPLV